MEGGGFGIAAADQLAGGEGDEDKRDGGHEEAEADVACCFDAGFAGGELVGVDAVDGLVTDEQGQVGHGVEDGVGHGGEQRERTGRDGAVDLQDGQDDIRGEAAVHGDLVLELVIVVDLLGRADVLFHGLQHALDIPVLAVVEPLQSLRRGRLVILDDCARNPASLSRRVRLDLLDFFRRFQLRC